MPKARKLPSGNWQAEGVFRDERGTRIRKSFTAESKKKAEEMALAFSNAKKKPQGMTVLEALDRYLASRRPVLSPSTMRSYKGIRNALHEKQTPFCSLRVDKIKSTDVQRLINALAADHTPKCVRNYHALLTASFAACGAELPPAKLPARVRPEYHIPDTNAVQRILAASAGTELEIPILLAAVCTMRAGEIAALSMDDIQGDRIHVHHNMVRDENSRWVTKSPKTYSSDRYIDAPEWIIDKIRTKGYITKHNPTSLSIAFGKMLKRNDLPHCRFHDLRHYSASYMHAQGIPTAYIMKRGGWQTETVLNAVYRHALSDRERTETARINNAFSAVLG